MVRMSRILRDYSDAGGLNTLLAPWGFVDEGALLTKAGHLARSYAVRGIDVDATDSSRTPRARSAHGSRPASAGRAVPRLSVPREANRGRLHRADLS